MSKKSESDVFKFLGFGDDAVAKGTQHVTDCPFCNKEGKFYFDRETTLWDCKSCGENGNGLQFMHKYHAMALAETSDSNRKSLLTARPGITLQAVKQAGIAWDNMNDRWLVPYPSTTGSGLNSLGGVDLNRGSRIFKAPGVELQLYDPFSNLQSRSTVYICEGEWDALALYPFLSQEEAVVAVPGATVFKDSWLELFRGKDVVLLYDNDDAGETGWKKASKKLNGYAKTLRRIDWKKLESMGVEAKDIRDIASNTGSLEGNPQDVLIDIDTGPMAEVVEAVQEGPHYLPPVDRIVSWKQLKYKMNQELYLTNSNEACIAVCLATVVSTYVPGEPIWMFLVGPASCGKTTLIEAFGVSNMYCEAQSHLHSKVLVSGWRDGDGEDSSLLPRLKRRTLLIKDFTTVVSMSHAAQDELYGLLRDAFDGTFRKQYGNRVERHYSDIRFGFIAGVTNVIHGDCRSSLGERFLKIHYLDEDFDEERHMMAAMDAFHHKQSRGEALQRTMLGYVHHLIQNIPEPDQLPYVNSYMRYRICNLAIMVSYLRAQVERRGDDSLLYRPAREVASRVAVQLKKLCECLMLVMNKTVADEEVYQVLRKVALDSCIPFNVELVNLLNRRPNGMTRGFIANKLQIPSTNVYRLLVDLQQLGVVQVQEQQGERGRPNHVYQIHPRVIGVWRDAIQPFDNQQAEQAHANDTASQIDRSPQRDGEEGSPKRVVPSRRLKTRDHAESNGSTRRTVRRKQIGHSI